MALILLAEDDDSMRSFLAKALERAGHRVRAVADGIDALAALAEEDDIDLLLADVVMPGLDGIELARRASAVALKAREEAPRGARVLSKPFHLRDLVNQVDAMLAAEAS
jgi:two-component system cell cycle response regulator CpdR